MKYGKEVEGSNVGLTTVFCQVEEIPNLFSDKLLQLFSSQGFQQIYISDHSDQLTLAIVSPIREVYPDCIITIETMGLPSNRLPAELVSYMVNVPFPGIPDLNTMGSSDQLKLSWGQNVLTVHGDFSVHAGTAHIRITKPWDFEGDIEL